MKTFIKILSAAAVAALAVVSCDKQENILDNCTKTVNFTASEIATKTVFGTPDAGSYPTLWTAGSVKVSLNYAKPVRAAITPSADGTTADFSASIADNNKGSYLFSSISPADAGISLSSGYKSWTVEIPQSQKSTAISVDEKAQVLVAKAKTTEMPSSITMNYKHVTAYGRLSLTGLPSGISILSVDLIAEKNWAGRYFYYIEDNNTNLAGTLKENGASNSINVSAPSPADIWFACAPVDLGGTQLTVKVNASTGIYEKKVTIPVGKVFTAGKVAKFKIDMSGVLPSSDVVYDLVTSLDQLTSGSEVIIANLDGTKAMSSAQNKNNRKAVDISLTDNKIINPAEAVAIFTVKNGFNGTTLAFKDSQGYIYAAGGTKKNQLKTKATLALDASWNVTIATGGSATIVCADSEVQRNTIRYNLSSDIFSCYASDSTYEGLRPIAIYKKK